MSKVWDYKLLDPKYDNLKRWFEAMVINHPLGLNSSVRLGSIIGPGGMFDFLDNGQKLVDESIENVLFSVEPLFEKGEKNGNNSQKKIN